MSNIIKRRDCWSRFSPDPRTKYIICKPKTRAMYNDIVSLLNNQRSRAEAPITQSFRPRGEEGAMPSVNLDIRRSISQAVFGDKKEKADKMIEEAEEELKMKDAFLSEMSAFQTPPPRIDTKALEAELIELNSQLEGFDKEEFERTSKEALEAFKGSPREAEKRAEIKEIRRAFDRRETILQQLGF
tara:strand:+ start:21 stop:578 length:558 start_codon:yes stop_codon:yes gene_type:complete